MYQNFLNKYNFNNADTMNDDVMKDIMFKFIRDYKNVTFVELEELFDCINFDYRGEYSFIMKYKTVLAWYGWNKRSFDFITDLRNEKKIELEACNIIVYLMDGKTLNLPIVKKSIEYKKDHWLPVTINLFHGEPAQTKK